jgi:thiol-disulfide isomerase/thioredoxin
MQHDRKVVRPSGWLRGGGLVLLLLLSAGAASPAIGLQPELRSPSPAPEFTHTDAVDWINSAPLRLSELRGKVLLIDFWAFECWNCYRSFPWLRGLESAFEGTDLQVIGVHAPEFERERDAARVAAKVREFALEHPVMIDNDFSYWRAMQNRYWPTYYLIDRQGRVRYRFIGETHVDSPQAANVEKAILTLLAEDSPST